ncbi:MAG: hypothetical protein M1840_008903 [Geoglossum simile]|nr:MAG: hypothetical protein M1840_008903 [Geoglossum simile]
MSHAESSRVGQQSLPCTTSSSTPAKSRGGTSEGELALKRAESAMDTLTRNHRIWVEKPQTCRSPMLERLSAKLDAEYASLARRLVEVSEVATFLASAGSGGSNEEEFSSLVGLLTEGILGDAEQDPGVRFVRSGNEPMRARVDYGVEIKTPGHGLKPDFFTSRIRYDDLTGDLAPLSLSTILQPSPTALGDTPTTQEHPRRSARLAQHPQRSYRDRSQGCESPPVLMNHRAFRWNDIQTIWEIKSNSQEINNRAVWASIVLKAAETMRHQWHRNFVLGFIACGTKLRLLRCSRASVLISAATDLENQAGQIALVECILSALTLSPTALGFRGGFDSPPTIEIDGRRHLLVQVGGVEFVLGKQTVWPHHDYLVGRATTVHLARRPRDREWKYCFKSSWPYAARPHEGEILEKLRGIQGVVRVLAWDQTVADDDIDASQMREEFSYYEKPKPGPKQQNQMSGTDQEGSSVLESTDDSLFADSDSEEDVAPPSLHPRQHRQIVTTYIPASLPTSQLLPLPLLHAWKSLYKTIDLISLAGFVHRDLSPTNVRLSYHNNPNKRYPNVTLIDFDLASPIVGPGTGAPDKTGTVLFMPIEILEADPTTDGVRHQELHEDEVAFWLIFFDILRRGSRAGRERYTSSRDPYMTLQQIANAKVGTLTFPTRTQRWPKWFPSSEAQGGKEAWSIVREVCDEIYHILMVRETGVQNYAYPSVGDVVGDEGIRRHRLQHEGTLHGILRALGRGIERLESPEDEQNLLALTTVLGL